MIHSHCAALKIDSSIYMDIELGYDVNHSLRITAGGSNIFDESIDEIAAANYEGGSWYLRANYSF